MKLATSLALALTVAITGAQTWAATDAVPDAHHPADTVSAPAAKTMPSKTRLAMAGVDSQMKSMQDMHNKMMAAPTPGDRSALMAEHMKTMQDGMTMMNGMATGAKSGIPKELASRQQIMEKQMEMMQSVLQMMVDRLPLVPAK